jgi:hypothetical protein
MASTFTAGRVASGIQPRAELGLNCVSETYELTAALVINDVIQMVKIPAGAIIQEVILSSDDIDTGSPAVVLAVGDGAVPDRFIKGSTIGQAGGTERMGMVTTVDSHKYTYTADDTIDIKCTTAPATGVVGTLVLSVFYTFQE